MEPTLRADMDHHHAEALATHGEQVDAVTAAEVVLHTGGMYMATEKSVVEKTLGRRPGVTAVDANPVAQTANVTFDTRTTSVAELRGWVEECGLHCAGRSVPTHVCDAMEEPAAQAGRESHADHEMAAEVTMRSPHEAMGHGGHAGMSMDAMVRDMRNRFVVAAVLSLPILLCSPIGREVFGFDAPAPFGLRDDVFSLLLSLPVIFYSSWIFFDGAWRALRARTLDMMVLVAVAIGAGWIYSVAITFTGGGEVFYEAATVLAAFVLLGHWFEMRARGGANDAIRTLLDLAPPMAEVVPRGRHRRDPHVGGRRRGRPTRATRDQDRGRRDRRGRRERRRRVDGDGREPAGPQIARRRGHRGHDQRERRAAGPRHQGRLGHGARADRASWCRRRRTRRRQANGSPIGPRSGSCSSPCSAGPPPSWPGSRQAPR